MKFRIKIKNAINTHSFKRIHLTFIQNDSLSYYLWNWFKCVCKPCVRITNTNKTTHAKHIIHVKTHRRSMVVFVIRLWVHREQTKRQHTYLHELTDASIIFYLLAKWINGRTDCMMRSFYTLRHLIIWSEALLYW